jgi:carboxyl-terminal processing protease
MAALMLPFTVGAAPAVQPAQDLRESYHLLSTTYYSKVDAQKMLDGARDALVAEVHKSGGRVSVPALRDSGSSEQNVRTIAQEIVALEGATHESNTDLTYAAIGGMAQSLRDRYTSFFTPEQFREFNNALDPEKISGIGVMIQPDPVSKYIQAYYVVPGTPAEKAGLQSGDLFTSIDGVSTKNFSTDDASKRLRGKSGSAVRIATMRDGKALAAVDITRMEVQPPSVIYKMLPGHVAYIWILQFGKATPQEFNVALERAQKSDVQAYVIDLRNDGGGYVNSALDISSKFIKDDPLLTIEERGAEATTVDAPGQAIPPKPMAILVNGGTASASEITAGALQDDGVAVLVGERTFGKGVMQSLTELPDGAAIKITIAHYLTPKNRDINLKGIEPDFSVPENKDARLGEPGHDAQLQAALNILSRKIADAKP